MILGPPVAIPGVAQHGGLRRARATEPTRRHHQGPGPAAIHFQVGMDGPRAGSVFHQGDGNGVPGQRVTVAVLAADLAGDHIRRHHRHPPHAGLIQQGKRLQEPHHKPRTALVDVQAQHVGLQAQPPLDQIAGGRHKVVRRLGEQDQRIQPVARQFARAKQILKPMHHQVRYTLVPRHQPPLVKAHDFFELARPRLRGLERPHVIQKILLVRGQHNQIPRDGLVRIKKSHGDPLYGIPPAVGSPKHGRSPRGE
jgi:hypothetical protein